MSPSMDRTASCLPGFEDLQMLTTADVATLLVTSEKAVRQMVARHDLEAHRISNGYRFTRSAIVEMLERTRTGQVAAGKPSPPGRFQRGARRPKRPTSRTPGKEPGNHSGARRECGAPVSKKGTLTGLVKEET